MNEPNLYELDEAVGGAGGSSADRNPNSNDGILSGALALPGARDLAEEAISAFTAGPSFAADATAYRQYVAQGKGITDTDVMQALVGAVDNRVDGYGSVGDRTYAMLSSLVKKTLVDGGGQLPSVLQGRDGVVSKEFMNYLIARAAGSESKLAAIRSATRYVPNSAVASEHPEAAVGFALTVKEKGSPRRIRSGFEGLVSMGADGNYQVAPELLSFLKTRAQAGTLPQMDGKLGQRFSADQAKALANVGAGGKLPAAGPDYATGPNGALYRDLGAKIPDELIYSAISRVGPSRSPFDYGEALRGELDRIVKEYCTDEDGKLGGFEAIGQNPDGLPDDYWADQDFLDSLLARVGTPGRLFAMSKAAQKIGDDDDIDAAVQLIKNEDVGQDGFLDGASFTEFLTKKIVDAVLPDLGEGVPKELAGLIQIEGNGGRVRVAPDFLELVAHMYTGASIQYLDDEYAAQVAAWEQVGQQEGFSALLAQLRNSDEAPDDFPDDQSVRSLLNQWPQGGIDGSFSSGVPGSSEGHPLTVHLETDNEGNTFWHIDGQSPIPVTPTDTSNVFRAPDGTFVFDFL